MKSEFWHHKWKAGETGFHQLEINPLLLRHAEKCGLAAGDRVFVPLCGKSRDMLWLAERGYPVTGVELSPLATEAFFSENGLSMETRVEGDFVCFRGRDITIYQGDFFALTEKQLRDVRAVYDRAALIALPMEMRRQYAEKLRKLLPADCQILLLTLEYDQNEMDGPPFSVTGREVDSLFGGWCEIELLESVAISPIEDRFLERGLTRLSEHIYRLTLKA